jgi:hypothetical protein
MPLQRIVFTAFFIVLASAHLRAQHNDAGIFECEIHLSLSGCPVGISVEKTPLRYNKRFAMSFHTDDGIADVYTVGFPFFTGINRPSGRYSGLFYTDGCGNDVSFKISSSLFSFSAYNNEDMHRPGNSYNTVSWPQLDTMYNNGCGIYNHGFTSDAPLEREEMAYSIKRNESYIRRSLISTTPQGVKTRVFVNPNGVPDYTPAAFSLGYRYAMRMGAWSMMPETGMNVNAFNRWDSPLEINRVLAENIDVKQLADQLRTKSTDGAHYWIPVFTHRIIEDYPLQSFFSDWNYISNTYGKNGSDEIWMASEEEILNYLLVRQRIEIKSRFMNNTLVITLSGHLPPDLRFYPLTLLVQTPGEIIKSLSISEGFQITHSATGSDKMLINLSWEGNREPTLAKVAEMAVMAAERNISTHNALIAMDYVIAMPHGQKKQSLRHRLCALKGIEYEQGFCPTETLLDKPK